MNEEKSSRLRRAFCSCEVKGTREMKTLVVYFSAEIVDARLMNGAGEREMKEWVK